MAYVAVWNLFLALLPVALSGPAARRLADPAGRRGKGLVGTVALLLAWLLLLPNAPYLLTDIRHFLFDPHWRALTAIGAATNAYAEHADAYAVAVSWACAFALYGAVGVVLFVVAVRPVARAWQAAGFSSAVAAPALFFAVALGVHLGLAHRWNSWDALLSPGGLVASAVSTLLRPRSLVAILALAAFLAGAYTILVPAVDRVAAALAGPRRRGAPAREVRQP